jgi:hypothetical protein
MFSDCKRGSFSRASVKKYFNGKFNNGSYIKTFDTEKELKLWFAGVEKVCDRNAIGKKIFYVDIEE